MNEPKKENVLKFPDSKIFREVPTETKKNLMDKQFQKEIAEVSENIGNDITEVLRNLSPETYDEQRFNDDLSFTLMILEATIYRMHGIPHDLHDYIDDATSEFGGDSFVKDGELEIEVEFEPELNNVS